MQGTGQRRVQRQGWLVKSTVFDHDLTIGGLSGCALRHARPPAGLYFVPDCEERCYG